MKGHCCQQVGNRVYWFQKRCREIIPGCDCHYYTDIWWESVLTYAVLLHITWSGFSLFFGSSSAHQLNAFPRRRSDSGAIKQPFSVSRSSFRRGTYLLQISKWTYFVYFVKVVLLLKNVSLTAQASSSDCQPDEYYFIYLFSQCLKMHQYFLAHSWISSNFWCTIFNYG